MTGAISHKLRSQRGASMLLALLFLLICSMVTASILMAAVSNAGKHRSNLEEHQIYLALSSAVSTVCDELNRCEYRGRYSSWYVPPEYGEDGSVIQAAEWNFQQETGAYTYREDPPPESGVPFNSILLSDFDAIFRKEAEKNLQNSFPIVTNKTDSSLFRDSDFDYDLTLSPNTGIAALDDRKVHLTLEVKDSYAIYITAYLKDLPAYTVTAELTPNENKPMITSLNYAGSDKTEQTEPMQWRLGRITIWNDDEEGGAGS